MTSFEARIAKSPVNNFNGIRLMLSMAVILSHAFPLSLGVGGEGMGEPLAAWTCQQQSLGSIAVSLFFLISGMLVTASWLRSGTLWKFLMRRVLRIYPGYICAIGFSGAVIWALCPDFRTEATNSLSWPIQVLKDCVFLTCRSPQWGGVFPHNPFPGGANGSLWTIQIEGACYLLTAALGLCRLFKHRLLLLLATCAVLLAYQRGLFINPQIGMQFPRFATYYLLGMSVWLWRDRIPFSSLLALACLAGLVAASQFKPWFAVLFPVLGSYAALWLAYAPPIPAFAWTRSTDLSYGTYLYAFPVQQIVAMHETLQNPWVNFLVSVPVTLALAWLSWDFIEKRFLALKSRVVRDNTPDARDHGNIGPLQ